MWLGNGNVDFGKKRVELSKDAGERVRQVDIGRTGSERSSLLDLVNSDSGYVAFESKASGA